MRIPKSNKMYTTKLVNEYYEFELSRCMRRILTDDLLQYRLYLPADFTKDYKKLIELDLVWECCIVRPYYSSADECVKSCTVVFLEKMILDNTGVYFKMYGESFRKMLSLEREDKLFVRMESCKYTDPFTMIPWGLSFKPVNKQYVDSALVTFKHGIPR